MKKKSVSRDTTTERKRRRRRTGSESSDAAIEKFEAQFILASKKSERRDSETRPVRDDEQQSDPCRFGERQWGYGRARGSTDKDIEANIFSLGRSIGFSPGSKVSSGAESRVEQRTTVDRSWRESHRVKVRKGDGERQSDFGNSLNQMPSLLPQGPSDHTTCCRPTRESPCFAPSSRRGKLASQRFEEKPEDFFYSGKWVTEASSAPLRPHQTCREGW